MVLSRPHYSQSKRSFVQSRPPYSQSGYPFLTVWTYFFYSPAHLFYSPERPTYLQSRPSFLMSVPLFVKSVPLSIYCIPIYSLASTFKICMMPPYVLMGTIYFYRGHLYYIVYSSFFVRLYQLNIICTKALHIKR